MKLFHFPGSCSLGIHILLEEVGVSYEIEIVDLKNRAQFTPEFLSVNPKGKVPALVRDDESVITEFQSIALWLAKSFPEANLIGQSLEEEVRTLELMDHIVGSVHMRGVTFVFVPMKFMKKKAAQDELQAFGLLEVEKGLKQLSDALGDQEFLLNRFSIADAALFYLLRFTDGMAIQKPNNLQMYFDRLKTRPSIAVALSNI